MVTATKRYPCPAHGLATTPAAAYAPAMAEADDTEIQGPLEELLGRLKDAIGACEEGTGDRAELARLAGEVERRLHDDDPDGVVDDLRDEITRFEASHPSLANAIGRAADALSALGL